MQPAFGACPPLTPCGAPVPLEACQEYRLMRTSLRGWAVRCLALAMAIFASTVTPVQAQTPYVPYFGKNAIKYDHFKWSTYTTEHFEIYYYPEIEPFLEKMAGYAESAYQHISSE